MQTNPPLVPRATLSASARRVAAWTSAGAAALGLATHAYLAFLHYDVQYGAATGNSICNVSEKFNCEAVSASQYSEFLHVPLALWGFAANVSFLLLLAAWAVAEPSAKRGRAAAALGVAGLILAASLVMGGISAFLMAKYCLFCMGAYALSAATLAGAWRALKADAFSRPALGEPSALGAALTPAIVALVVPALGMFLANWKIGDAYGEREIGPLVDRAVADWLGTAPVNVDPAFPLVRGASPERAKLTLIEFADFRCGHCKHAAPTLDAFVASRPDVRFLFQPWPLDGACNPKIPQAYGASCALARASYCASKSGSATGWAAHKWLYEQQEKFTSNEAVDKAIGAMAGEIGLQEAALVACVASDEARDAVAKQSAVGDALDIPGTPTIYANGRKLPYGQVLAVLRAAYDHAAEVPPPNRP